MKGRVEALDAFRGLAILGMAWSGMLPDTLPAWMYHAQLPPPKHVFDPTIYGLTWVDLVFPFFLFSLGAAIPLALTSRLEKGESPLRIVLGLFARGLLLAGFAIFGEHLRSGEWSNPQDASAWLAGLVGFVLLVLMFLRWPARVPKNVARIVSAGAWLMAGVLIAWHMYPDGKRGFENSRNDIILMVLANVAVSGGVIWLLARCRPLLRLALMVVVAVIFLSANTPGSLAKLVWDYTPLQHVAFLGWAQSRFFPIFYHFEYHKYLLIVLPGTFCGDLLLKRRTLIVEQACEGAKTGRSIAVGLALISLAFPVIACFGLFSHEVIATSIVLIFCSAILLFLTSRLPMPQRELLMGLGRWGVALLVIGLLAEPLGGGIRKDSPTLSYFLVTAGLAFLLVLGFICLLENLNLDRPAKFLTMTGANPILGYLVITNLVMGLAGLSGWSDRIAATQLINYPWGIAFVDGGFRTVLVAVVTSAFTKYRLFLRT